VGDGVCGGGDERRKRNGKDRLKKVRKQYFNIIEETQIESLIYVIYLKVNK
jgi:hypothetical protein